jgi:hypothetical protein
VPQRFRFDELVLKVRQCAAVLTKQLDGHVDAALLDGQARIST